jgi:Glycosyl transferase family 2
MKRVSVIIPTFNYGEFIAEAIASVQVQTYPVAEIVVVDDGSTDDTKDVLASIDDPRLKVLRTPNRGVSTARNEGLAAATGEFISFLDADDRWRPAKTERQMSIMDSDPTVGAVFTNFVRFEADRIYERDQFSFHPGLKGLETTPVGDGGRRLAGDSFAHLVSMEEVPSAPPTLLFRADVIQGLRFDPTIRICEDWHFCLRAYRRTRVAYIADPLCEVRRHTTNSTVDLRVVPAGKLQALRGVKSFTDPTRPRFSRAQARALSIRTGRAWVEVGLVEAAAGRRMRAANAFFRGGLHPGARVSAAANLAVLAVPPLRRAVDYLRAKRNAGVTSRSTAR